MSVKWNPSGTHLEPQVRLGKDRSGQFRGGEIRRASARFTAPPHLPPRKNVLVQGTGVGTRVDTGVGTGVDTGVGTGTPSRAEISRAEHSTAEGSRGERSISGNRAEPSATPSPPAAPPPPCYSVAPCDSVAPLRLRRPL